MTETTPPTATSAESPATALQLPTSTPDPASRSVILIETAVVIALAVFPDLLRAVVSFSVPRGNYSFLAMSAISIARSISVSSVIMYLIWRSGLIWSDFGLRSFHILLDPLGIIVVIVAMYLSLGITFRAIYAAIGRSAYDQLLRAGPKQSDLYAKIISPSDWIYLAVMCALNGFAEEIAMRGYLMTRFLQIFRSRLIALLLSTALFAAYHVYQGAGGLINAAVVGLIFGSFFLTFRRVWPLVIAHGLVDFISFARMNHH
jgi:membrane protease YdiL (CAAX protease family)